MFDRLIESGCQPRGRRTSGYLLAASVLYFGALVVSASLAIMWFNPGLVEALEMNARLTPPPPFTSPQRLSTQTRTGPARSSEADFVSPTRIVPRSEEIRPDLPVINTGPSRVGPLVVGGQRSVPGGNWNDVADGSRRDGAPVPPPRDPPPTPTPATPRAAESKLVVSEVLQGRAITSFTPPYPDLARKVGVSGPVQIQVLISEDGRVVEATVLNGHPLLRGAALSAAKRWVFSPTKLSGMPVRVQGILTFNFTLN